jgi:peroxiredoxin
MVPDSVSVLMTGRILPGDIGRTDEGTPVSLLDFKGRALVIILTGEGLEKDKLNMLKHIKNDINGFYKYSCSPVLVSFESEQLLAAARELNNLPFMMISDFSRDIHRAMGFDPALNETVIWIADEDSKLVAAIPFMASREQLSTALAALPRLFK